MALPPDPLPESTPSTSEPAAAPPIAELIASDVDPAERARIEAFQERLTRRPWVTWALITTLALMFGAQALLGGVDDPWVMIRLGGQAPGRIAEGEWWRLVSGAFLHSGFIHFALNTWVLLVVGTGLERIIGSARCLFAYAFSVIAASLAALVFSDAPLTVGASGGVFGLFGVELVVVLLRPELLPSEVRAKHTRTVLTNLVLNVANSFRPNIAMAAHFGGGVAGAVIGLLLVPRTFDADRGSEPVWVKVGAGLGGLVLASGLALALNDAFFGDIAAPTVARTVIHGVSDPGASAEIPSSLAAVLDHPGTFGDIQHDPAVVSVNRFVGLGVSGERLEDELAEAALPPEYRLASGSETSVGGHRAYVAHYDATEAPLVVERVFVREETSGWLVEAVYWAAAREAWDGIASRIAASIEEEPIARGERLPLVCDRWAAHLPPGATVGARVSCGDPVTDVALETRGVAGMTGHFEVTLDGCMLDVRTRDELVALMPAEDRHAPPEGETFAMEVGEIGSTPALRVLTNEAALVARFEGGDSPACAAALQRVRETMRRTIEVTPLAPNGAIETPIEPDGDRLSLTAPPGAVVLALGGSPPDANAGAIAYDVTYELRLPNNAARAVWSSDRVEPSSRSRGVRLTTSGPLVAPADTWLEVPELEGAGTCSAYVALTRPDRRVTLYLCGPEADRAPLRAVLDTMQVHARGQ